MDFIEFLNETGEATVASLLGIARQTVREWRLENKCPRPMFAYKLTLLTEGKLTFEDIYLKYCTKHLTDHLQKHKTILQNVLEK